MDYAEISLSLSLKLMFNIEASTSKSSEDDVAYENFWFYVFS